MLHLLQTFLLLYLVVLLRGDKILFMMPHPSISHQMVARSLTKNLAHSGEVVMVTPRPAFTAGDAPPNITEVDVSDNNTTEVWNNALALITGKRSHSYHTTFVTYLIALNMFFKQLKKPELQELYQDKFDLVVAENLFRSTVALSRVFDAPLVHFSTFGLLYFTDFEGTLTHYQYYPYLIRVRIHNLSFWEKLTELYDYFYNQIIFELRFPKYEEKADEAFQFHVDVKALRKNVQLTLLNTNAIWYGNRPRSLSVVYIDGIHKPQQRELPQELKEFLDSSVHGVIYVSFGTSVISSRLPHDRILDMVKVLSQMPYDVLWKWDGELPMSADNIRVVNWLPQADLLKHPNIKLFITQAGIHSTEEAINAGVPLLGLPLIADQWYNAEKYAHFIIGKQLDLHDLTEESFKNTIETIIHNDEMYRRNVARLRVLIADQPLSPEERVAWAIQRARRRHAGAWMRAPSADMSIIQYFELQLVITVLLAVILIATLIYLAIRRLWARISRNVSFCLKIKII